MTLAPKTAHPTSLSESPALPGISNALGDTLLYLLPCIRICLYDEGTYQAHTAHTLNFVPVIVAGQSLAGKKLTVQEGKLADIAPTVLKLIELKQPSEMTGTPLL